ncbi:hypothetical protein AABC73_13350 [Pseudomonas sp. G.S.17]|uniref:hypothetical protein n=1 Tax=Pseudomonas sp. G.S.17 TaxID=3137451 RepID=UPI00311CAA2A
MSFRRWLEYYAALIPKHEAGLLDRRDMMSLLWPTIFAFGASVTLRMIHCALPIVALEKILMGAAPFGCLVKALCTWGAKDYAKICEYRAATNDMDLDNCRNLPDGWLNGPGVPNLDRADEILRALGLGLGLEFSPKLWILAARLLGRTPKESREAIANFLTTPQHAKARKRSARNFRRCATLRVPDHGARTTA